MTFQHKNTLFQACFLKLYCTFPSNLFPLGNESLHVKQMIYVLIYSMHLYLRYSLTSIAFTVRMVAKCYQRMVSLKNENSFYQSNISPSLIKTGIFICLTPFLFWMRSFLVSRYFGYPSLIVSKGRYSRFSVSMLFMIVIATWIYA